MSERESPTTSLEVRDRLVEGVLEQVTDAQLTGHPTDRLPGHASLVFKNVESNLLLMHLDQRGKGSGD